MAKFGVTDADNYGGQGGNYFSLKDDGDSAVVRFMYNSIEDIDGYAVHRVDVGNNKFRYVNCLREYNDPLDVCPLCAARNFQQAKFYFNIYDLDEEEVKIWERGKQILKSLVPVLQQINGPICGTPVKIIRHGQAGDQYTKYDFELLAPDGVTMEDLPDPIDPNEKIILTYTFDELQNFVKTGRLPNAEVAVDNSNGYNSGRNNNYSNNNGGNEIRRRYPSNDNNGRGGTGNNRAF